MKIGSNSIGNYGPVSSTQSVQPAVREAVAEVNYKTDNAPMSQEEKNFFLKMYPKNETDINNYHFYAKDGQMSGVKIGSLFDRRG